MCSTHNKCQVLAGTQDQDLPEREKQLKNLHDMLQIREESIVMNECINEEVIGVWIVQVFVHKHMFEEMLSQNAPKVKEIESQLSKHEITTCLLEPTEYRIINEEAQAWDVFIKKPTGPT